MNFPPRNQEAVNKLLSVYQQQFLYHHGVAVVGRLAKVGPEEWDAALEEAVKTMLSAVKPDSNPVLIVAACIETTMRILDESGMFITIGKN